jgi:D-alanyl-D-alanine carboxypeptidase
MFSFKNVLASIGVAALLILPRAHAGAGQELIDAARIASGAPGMAAALISSEGIDVFASGQRRIDQPASVARDDSFHVGSDMKAMVATLIAQQIEAGRLRWDSTIQEVLPDVAVFARREYRRVTVTQLMQHRGGVIPMLTLDDVHQVPRLRGSLIQQRLQFARWVLAKKPIATPGTATEYSNAGYLVAAAMLERVSGRTTETLLQTRLFAPLGIKSARFAWPAAGRRNEPWGHALVDDTLVPMHPNDPTALVPEWVNPAGNLSLSTRDFARFVQLHLRGLRGISTYLDAGTFRQLHQPVDGYACGWAVIETGGPTISLHTGGSDLFYAVMVIVPEVDRAVVVVINADYEAVHEAAFVLASQLINLQP